MSFGYDEERADRHRRDVVLVVGPPASGKTTYILKHKKLEEHMFLGSARHWQSIQQQRRELNEFMAWAQWGEGTLWIEADHTDLKPGGSFRGCKVRDVVRLIEPKAVCKQRIDDLEQADGQKIDRAPWHASWCREALNVWFKDEMER